MATNNRDGRVGGKEVSVKYVACTSGGCPGQKDTKRLEGPLLHTSHYCKYCETIIYKPEDKNL